VKKAQIDIIRADGGSSSVEEKESRPDQSKKKRPVFKICSRLAIMFSTLIARSRLISPGEDSRAKFY
jgi:hypothetical protein